MKNTLILLLLVASLACTSTPPQGNEQNDENQVEVTSLLGKKLSFPDPPAEHLDLYNQAKAAYQSDTTDLDQMIWYGRYAALIGQFNESIDLFTNAISRYPDDPRLYRYRGHRYISIRKFENAIKDLEKASELLQGKEVLVETNILPNAENIDISSLQERVYYYLGLAYYFRQDMDRAYRAFRTCYDYGRNDDNLVAAVHWLYMSGKRLGKSQEAEALLNQINPDLEPIQNGSYLRSCLFYKGVLKQKDLLDPVSEAPENDALGYTLANWYYYNGAEKTAKSALEDILDSKSWYSFAFLAAESDYFHNYQQVVN